MLVASGGYFARNQRLYGHALLTGYDFHDRATMTELDGAPLLGRRAPGYLLGWTADIYRRPTWPAGYQPVPRFFPVLIASTFADYYRYAFAPDGDWSDELEDLPTRTAWDLGRASIVAGTVIAAFVAVAWLIALAVAWRRRAHGTLALLLVPPFAVVGQLWFAWRFPVDLLGPVKGVYVQFAALPLCGLFGLAVGRLWYRRGGARALAGVGLVALVTVAAYTGYCRLASPPIVWEPDAPLP